MAETWWGAYECYDCKISVDVAKLDSEASKIIWCPTCKGELELREQWEADRDGYGSRAAPSVPKARARLAVEVLNRAVASDLDAIANLLKVRVYCNEALANDPTIQVLVQEDQRTLGTLGLINGLFGIREDGWGHLCAIHDINCPGHGPLESFLTEEQAKGLTTKDKCPTCDQQLHLGKLVRFETVER